MIRTTIPALTPSRRQRQDAVRREEQSQLPDPGGAGMGYSIDPRTDRQYIEEFRRNPIGRHSPGLQRLLNAMRHDPTGWQVILVSRLPFAEWVLGRMPPKRTEPIQIESEPVFLSREEAEWEVFRRRWRAATGEDINLPFRD